ncbi:MAG: OstA-like protein [Ignavibacteria bacterium]|jgi:lipopolysaccharide export system protein LptA
MFIFQRPIAVRFLDNKGIFLICTLLMILLTSLPYSQDKITLNYADSLIGKTINGQQVREAIGNVSLAQNDVKITCGRVVQYFAENKAELYTNVKVVKDTMTITAPMGIYYGNESKVICSQGAVLNDTRATLTADYGIYLFSQDLANFRGKVTITDNKTYTITSDALDYYRSANKSYANGNVKIVTDSATIYSDHLIYEKLIGFSTATGNVKIDSDSTEILSDKLTYSEPERKSIAEDNVRIHFLNKNAVVYGNYGENYERINYSFVRGKAKLVQIENRKGREDTLLIYSSRMESFRDKPEHYIAKDSVRMIRSDFLSRSNIGYYFRDVSGTGGVISLSENPVVWKENLQVTGDSIYAFFKEDIDKIYVNKSAFAIQQNNIYKDRYDQISGVFMFMSFMDNEIDYIRVDTNAASIYFSYENGNPNGVNRATGKEIILYFKDKLVYKVKDVGDPKGKFLPENLINLADLKLLGFKLRNDRPVREE